MWWYDYVLLWYWSPFWSSTQARRLPPCEWCHHIQGVHRLRRDGTSIACCVKIVATGQARYVVIIPDGCLFFKRKEQKTRNPVHMFRGMRSSFWVQRKYTYASKLRLTKLYLLPESKTRHSLSWYVYVEEWRSHWLTLDWLSVVDFIERARGRHTWRCYEWIFETRDVG